MNISKLEVGTYRYAYTMTYIKCVVSIDYMGRGDFCGDPEGYS